LGGGNEGNGAFDVPERPQCEREVKHCGDAGVVPEAKGEIIVSRRPEQSERAFQISRALSYSPTNQCVIPAARCATLASGESGLASISRKKVAA
jgi:hypothetical protein